MTKAKYISIIVLFCLIIGILTGFLFLSPAKEMSESERRKLQQFPELSISSLSSGKFMREFETYLTDQFPLRDSFRRLKAIAHFELYNQKDNGGIYIKDGFVSKLDSEVKENSVKHFTDRITNLYNTYVKDNNCRSFYAVIPDKNYYLADESYPLMDYKKLFSIVDNDLSFMTKIDISDTLSIDSFYYTDTHWRQEKILDTAKFIRESMDMSPIGKYEKEEITDFYGVYYGQSALNLPSEKLYVMKNEATEKAETYNYEKDENAAVYNKEKLKSFDKYDVFLSGAVSLMEIKNPTGNKDKKLIIFRDSYGSSIAPLLMDDYGTVVLIDTRYISPELIGQYVDFKNSDVLFIYSILLINSSSTIR